MEVWVGLASGICSETTSRLNNLLCSQHLAVGMKKIGSEYPKAGVSGSSSLSCGSQMPLHPGCSSSLGNCCHKGPYSRLLETTEIYCLTVLEARSLKLRCQQGRTLPEDSREEALSLTLPNFWWLPVILGVPSLTQGGAKVGLHWFVWKIIW